MQLEKFFYNRDIVHVKFMKNPVECQDHVFNIACPAAINTF